MNYKIPLWYLTIRISKFLGYWLRKKRFYVFLIIYIALYNLLQLRMSDSTFAWQLSDAPFGYEPSFHRYQHEDRTMRYVEIGADSLPLIVLIHGSPSSSAIWYRFMKDSFLLSNAKIIAVDRPGYGYSGFGDIETSVEKQAAALAPILKEKRTKHEKIVLIGSSYGGTVAARLAMDYPDYVDALVFQSSSLAPGEETTYWITYPTTHWSLRWLVPTTLDVANAEKLAHREQLELMKPLWDRIRVPVTILHGDKDGLINFKNASFACEYLTNAPYVKLVAKSGAGHDLTWSAPELIKTSLVNSFTVIDSLGTTRLACK